MPTDRTICDLMVHLMLLSLLLLLLLLALRSLLLLQMVTIDGVKNSLRIVREERERRDKTKTSEIKHKTISSNVSYITITKTSTICFTVVLFGYVQKYIYITLCQLVLVGAMRFLQFCLLFLFLLFTTHNQCCFTNSASY